MSTEKNKNGIADLQTAFNIALLKEDAMQKVAAAKSKTMIAFLIIVAAALLRFLGGQMFSVFFKPSLQMGLTGAVMYVIQSLVFIYVLSFISKTLFHGKAKHDAFFRVLAYGMIVTWIGIFPSISILGSIWSLVIMIVVIKNVHKIGVGEAIGAFLVTLVIMIVLALVLSPLYGMIGMRSVGGSFSIGKYMGGESMMNFNSGYGGHMDIEDGENSVKFDDNSMTIKSKDGEGMVELKDGKMTIRGEDGEVVEIQIPTFE